MLDFETVRSILERHGSALGARVRPLRLGQRELDLNRRRGLVGVVNLSPDSWYRESVCESPEAAIARGRMLAGQGADLVDLGAESTLPQAERVGAAGQIERLVPVVRALAAEGIAVSAESYHPEVLEAAGEAGARVFNLTGSREEGEALKLAKRFGAAVILCYVQGETVREVGDLALGADPMAEMLEHFRERTARAAAAGVAQCILDPGLGFYYRNLEDGRLRVNHQLRTFLHSFRLAELGHPVMNILPHAPEIFGEPDRRAAEPFFAVLTLLGGTHLLRTHELRTVARIREVMDQYEGE